MKRLVLHRVVNLPKCDPPPPPLPPSIPLALILIRSRSPFLPPSLPSTLSLSFSLTPSSLSGTREYAGRPTARGSGSRFLPPRLSSSLPPSLSFSFTPPSLSSLPVVPPPAGVRREWIPGKKSAFAVGVHWGQFRSCCMTESAPNKALNLIALTFDERVVPQRVVTLPERETAPGNPPVVPPLA